MPQADPQAVPDIARRVAALQAAGHGWLEPQSQVALAAAPTSDQTMVAQASSFRQALNQTAAQSGTSLLGSVGTFFGDPVLQKQPSAALALRSYLLQKQGWMPIAEGDLRSIQQKLVDNGYLGQADVNGVWTPASQQAYYKATSDHIEQQQTHSGGFSIGHALAAFLPSHWIPALVGAAKAFPGELRDMVSSVAGDWAGMADTLAHPSSVDLSKLFTGGSAQGQQFAAGVQRDVRSGLGDPNAATKTDSPYSVHDQINNINVALTLMPVIRAGKLAYAGFDAARAAAANTAVNDAAGTGFFRGMVTDLGPEAAQRGPGVISKAIYSRTETNTTGLLGSRLFQQQPVMRFVSAPVRALYDPSGKVVSGYYAFRTGLATPYRLAGVQATGAAVNQAAVAGAAEQGITAVESKAGAKHTALSDQIHAEHLIGGNLGLALDLASGLFHGPINTAATTAAEAAGNRPLVGINPSHTVASQVDGAGQAFDAMLKPLNVGWALHAGTKLGGNPLTVEELIDEHGAAFTQQFLNDKLNQFAAAHHAEQTLGARELPLDSQTYMDEFRALTHEALNNPDVLSKARGEVLGDLVQVARRFAQDANSIHRDAQDAYRQGIGKYAAVWHPATELFANHAHELVGPHVMEQIRQARGLVGGPGGTSASDLPPEGMTRLFRGAAPAGTPGSLAGRWFTPWVSAARKYAGENGQVSFVDVPTGTADANTGAVTGHFRYQVKHGQGSDFDAARKLSKDHANEYLLPADVAAKAVPEVPSPAGPEPGAHMGYLAENHPGFNPGSLGLARKALAGQDAGVETQTYRQYRDMAGQLQKRLKAAGSQVHDPNDVNAPQYNPDAVQAVRKDAINYLFKYRGLNYKELDGLDAQQLIDTVTHAADSAPRDVTLALDASPEAAALVKQIGDAGYKIVAGTDIGHVFTPPVIDPVLIQGYKSRWRSVANVMGMNNVPVAVKEAGMIRRLLTERELQTAINDGRVRVPPGFNGARLNMWVLDNLASRADLTRGEAMAFAAGQKLHRGVAEKMLPEGHTEADVAEQLQKARTAIAKGTQPVEVRPQEIVKALTRDTPGPIKEAMGVPVGEALPLMDVKSAQTVADLYVRSMIHEPAWVFGAGKLEDLYRAGFGFLGSRASEKVPVLRSIARAPNASVRFRNRYRFQLDPMFSMKRVAKSALKASIPGEHGASAPFTVTPFHHMWKAGTLDHDLGVLNRVLPMNGAEGFDTNDRLLYEQDAFGIYNPRHHMAIRAGALARAGLDDKTIATDLKRTFTYGDRTALERSVGTIWYPFSFERTLWRNVGSYALDRPGSRLMAGVGMQAYSALSQHDGIDQWLKDHAPLLKEFQKMNAFEHGIGPGQVGGINAMYAPALWNLFGPQKYGAMKDPTTNALQNIFPVLRELNSLLVGYSPTTGTMPGGRPNGSLVQQAGIGLWATQHAVDRATTAIGLGHAADSPFNLIGKAVPLRDETVSAEQNKAWAYRNSLIMSLAPVLDFNYHNRGGERVWGSAAPANVQGKPINRSTIDEIVHDRYASYDPSVAQSLAVTKKTAMERYVADLTQSDPQRAAAYQQFMVPAEKLRPILQRAVTDPAKYGQLATVEQVFRDLAINMAEQDPKFVAFYNHFYLTEFGPIEAIQ